MPATEDEQIHHLQSLVNQLKKALNRIDSDVRHAAKRYLHSETPEGHLHFSDFIELLALEIRHQVKEQLDYDRRMLEVARKTARELISEKLEELAMSKLPALREEISEFVTIRVLLCRRKVISISGGPDSFHYQALTVKGSVKQGLGKTQEEAWAQLRERIAIELLERGTQERLLEFLSSEHPLILERFEHAAPWRTDAIGGFKVEIRIEDKT